MYGASLNPSWFIMKLLNTLAAVKGTATAHLAHTSANVQALGSWPDVHDVVYPVGATGA